MSRETMCPECEVPFITERCPTCGYKEGSLKFTVTPEAQSHGQGPLGSIMNERAYVVEWDEGPWKPNTFRVRRPDSDKAPRLELRRYPSLEKAQVRANTINKAIAKTKS